MPTEIVLKYPNRLGQKMLKITSLFLWFLVISTNLAFAESVTDWSNGPKFAGDYKVSKGCGGYSPDMSEKYNVFFGDDGEYSSLVVRRDVVDRHQVFVMRNKGTIDSISKGVIGSSRTGSDSNGFYSYALTENQLRLCSYSMFDSKNCDDLWRPEDAQDFYQLVRGFWIDVKRLNNQSGFNQIVIRGSEKHGVFDASETASRDLLFNRRDDNYFCVVLERI